MLVTVSKGSLSFGSHEIFEDLDFVINENDRMALIGRNGSGKTSLLKVINGEYELSSGDIFRTKGKEIAYLAQNAFPDETRTVRQEFYDVFAELISEEIRLNELSKALNENYDPEKIEEYTEALERFRLNGGYDYETEIRTILFGFGFKEDDLDRFVGSFSGGERTKIAFGKLLLQKPDLLLLDEPTNHLDLSTIEWLEDYLKQYRKALLIVSHDRVFLDRTVAKVYEIEYGHGKLYSGNYSAYAEQKKKDFELQENAYKRQQKEIKRLSEQIEKFRYKANKASFAQSKIKYLERMEKISDPKKADMKAFKAKFRCRYPGGKEVLQLDKYVFGYDQDHPLGQVDLKIRRGDRICVMGDNGTGKSTLLKTIVGQYPPLGGYSLFGHQIQFAYFEQNLNRFHPEKTVLQEIWDDYPMMDKESIRSVLGAFLFSADEVFKEVAVLSGGEKVRLALAKLMLEEANFLILDEPTNHLDIFSKEALETALEDYEGTVLFVSHDRYFIKKIANSCIVITRTGTEYYPDGYKDYIDQRVPAVKEEDAKEEEPAKKQGKQKTKYNLKKIEAEIQELEDELEEKRELRFEPEYYHSTQKMQELDQLIDEIHNRIHHKMEEWEAALEEDAQKKK